MWFIPINQQQLNLSDTIWLVWLTQFTPNTWKIGLKLDWSNPVKLKYCHPFDKLDDSSLISNTHDNSIIPFWISVKTIVLSFYKYYFISHWNRLVDENVVPVNRGYKEGQRTQNFDYWTPLSKFYRSRTDIKLFG